MKSKFPWLSVFLIISILGNVLFLSTLFWYDDELTTCYDESMVLNSNYDLLVNDYNELVEEYNFCNEQIVECGNSYSDLASRSYELAVACEELADNSQEVYNELLACQQAGYIESDSGLNDLLSVLLAFI